MKTENCVKDIDFGPDSVRTIFVYGHGNELASEICPFPRSFDRSRDA